MTDANPYGRSPRREELPESFDFIVIGSGPGGSPVAARLSENGQYSVLLLERGTTAFEDYDVVQVPRNWERTTSSIVDRSTVTDFKNEPVVNWNEYNGRISQGVGLGGTSLINSEMMVRGSPHDFDRWENVHGLPGWSYADVLPFFRKMENNTFKYQLSPEYHGNDGPLKMTQGTEFYPQDDALIAAAVKAGYPLNEDYNGEQQITHPRGSVSYFDMAVYEGKRVSAYESYVRPHLARKNLFVVDSAHVTRIIFDEDKRVTSVRWYDKLHDLMRTTSVTKEVIVSAGAIQTPKLLQLSGVGNATLLQSLGIPVVVDLPGVGENYIDHVITNLAAGPLPLENPPFADASAWEIYQRNRTGPYSFIGGRTVIFLRTKYQDELNDPRPDIEVIGYTPGQYVFGCIYLLLPKSVGHLRITSLDPFDDPKPIGNYLTHPHDVKTYCEGLRLLFKIYQTLGADASVSLGPKNLDDSESCLHFLAGQRPWSLGTTNVGSHWAGTAKMGRSSDPLAVTDARLRVYGVKGLRVSDASAFPEMVAGNTQLPTYLIGEKAAHMILQDNALSAHEEL